ncbi:unnamed protein product [Closterium sp. NIES-64]|nr:unnamed protein product [Closterium sp. NIES-64]
MWAVLGTWGYVAPEYVGSERVGVAADVFSFGVVLLELLSGQSPHNTEDLLERAEACLSEGALDSFADPALLASGFDEEQFLRVLRIALLCLEYNPHQRPPMASVVRFLTSPHAPLPDEDSPLEPILEGLGDGHGGGGGGADGGYSESSDTSGGLEDGCMAEEGGGEGGSWLNGGGGEGKEKGDGEDEVALGDGGGGAMGDGVEVVVDDVDDGHEGDARGSHVEGQGTLALNMVVAEAGNLSAAAEGSSGEEFSAMAEGTGDAQVPAEGGEGGTVEAGGSSGGGGGANAEMPGAGLPNPVYVGRHAPLEQLWQHIKELADSNHAMPVVRAWESNGNTVDMRLATQLIKKLKNHRRPKQAAELAERFVQCSSPASAAQGAVPADSSGVVRAAGRLARLEADYQLALSAVIPIPLTLTAPLPLPSPQVAEGFVQQPGFHRLEADYYQLALSAVAEWFVQQPGFPRLEADYQLALSAVIRSRNVAAAQALFLAFPQPFRTEKVRWGERRRMLGMGTSSAELSHLSLPQTFRSEEMSCGEEIPPPSLCPTSFSPNPFLPPFCPTLFFPPFSAQPSSAPLAAPCPVRGLQVYQPVFGHVARRGRFMSVESQVDWLRQQGVAEGIPSFNARLQALLAGRRRSGMVAGIAAIMDEMRSKGFTPITITFNIILAGLGRAGQLKEMEYYLGQMENYNLTPDLATMNALISAYVSHGEPEKALEWERRLKTSGAGPDRGTYAAMLKAYGQSGQVDKLEATWSELLASNVPMTRMLNKACIEGFGLRSSIHTSCLFSLFSLPIRPSHPPLPSAPPIRSSHPLPCRMLHKARIEGYGLAGDVGKAEQGYGLAGDVGKAEQAFQELKVQQAPVTETFNSLVFAYAHNHLFPKAKDTILHMDAAGMRPDGITFLHLLRGYLSANQIDNAVTTLHDAGGGRCAQGADEAAVSRVCGGAGGVCGGGGGGEGVKANAATEEILHPLGLSNLIDEVGLVRAGGF